MGRRHGGLDAQEGAMIRWRILFARITGTLIALCLLPPSLSIVAQADADREPAIDLAAMVPLPEDVLGGDYLEARGALHSELYAYVDDPLFMPTYHEPGLEVRNIDLLRNAGWQRTYTNLIGRPDPDTAEDYDRGIRFGLAEFGSQTGADMVATGLAELLHATGAENRRASLAANVEATLVLDRQPERAGREETKPMLIFRVERLLATIEFFDYAAEPFSADEVAAVGRLFLQRIDTVSSRHTSTLGLQALRLHNAFGIPATREWYLRRDGRDVPGLIDPGGEVQRNAYGEASDVYAVGQGFGEGASRRWLQTFVFRFPTEDQARAGFSLWQAHLATTDLDATPTRVTVDKAEQQAIHRVDPIPGEAQSVTIVTARRGRNAVMIRFDGTSVDDVAALVTAQLTCLEQNSACPSPAVPPFEEPGGELPHASPVAVIPIAETRQPYARELT
jgi:hypothetical protein